MASSGSERVAELIAELKVLRDEVAGGTFAPLPPPPDVQPPMIMESNSPQSTTLKRVICCSDSVAGPRKKASFAMVIPNEAESSSIWEDGDLSTELRNAILSPNDNVNLGALREHDWAYYLGQVEKWSLRSASLAGFYRVLRGEIDTLRQEKKQMVQEREALEAKLFEMEADKVAAEAKAEAMACQVEELKQQVAVSEGEVRRSYAAFQDEVRELEAKWLSKLGDKSGSREISTAQLNKYVKQETD